MKLIKRILLAALALCMTLGIVVFAAACDDEYGYVNYTVIVECEDEDALADVQVSLLKQDGKTAGEAQPLTDGIATFTLAPATYTVKLSGLKEGYEYPETTLTETKPAAKVKLTPPAVHAAFIGTWASEDGSEQYKVVVSRDNVEFYTPDGQYDCYDFEFSADRVLFTYSAVLLGQSFEYTYGLEFRNGATDVVTLFNNDDPDNFIDRLVKTEDPGEVDLPASIEGAWYATDSTLTFVGTDVMLELSSGLEPMYGTVKSYDADSGNLVLDFDGTLHNCVYVEEDQMLAVYMDEDEPLVFTREEPGLKIPEVFWGDWGSEYLNAEGKQDYIVKVTETSIEYTENGKVMEPYDIQVFGEESVVFYCEIAGEEGMVPYEYSLKFKDDDYNVLLLYGASPTTPLDTLVKGGGKEQVLLPKDLQLSKWYGTGENTDVTLTFGSYNTFSTTNGLSGTLTEVKENDTVLVFKNDEGDATYTFTYNKAEKSLVANFGDADEPYNVTFTSTPPEGSALNPKVLDKFEGSMNFDLAPNGENTYYLFTPTDTKIYTVTCTLNSVGVTINPKDNPFKAVHAWTNFGEAGPFELVAGTAYRIAIANSSSDPTTKSVTFEITKSDFFIAANYRDTWLDAAGDACKYKIVIGEKTITVNGDEAKDIHLEGLSGGYTFRWTNAKDSKTYDCDVSLPKEDSETPQLLFSWGSGLNDYVYLYKNGSAPEIKYGTEEHPYEITQDELVKDWSQSVADGLVYYTFKATKDQTYTLTTTGTNLIFALTDTTNDKAVASLNGEKEVVFHVTNGRTYTFYLNSSEDLVTTVTFKIAEGGTLSGASVPAEILGVKWVNADGAAHTIEFTETTATFTKDTGVFGKVSFTADITGVENTDTQITVTFQTLSGTKTVITVVYDKAKKTLVVSMNDNHYNFKQDESEGGGGSGGGDTQAWQGTLPEKWYGTWQLKDFGTSALSQSVTIDAKSITWETGAGAGKTITITNYDEATMVITFVTDDGLTGKIERQFVDDTDTITAIKINFNGQDYQNLRKPTK